METLRDETAGKIKTTTIYPGAVNTELGHDLTSPKVLALKESFGDYDRLDASAISDAVIYAISQPGNIAVKEENLQSIATICAQSTPRIVAGLC